MGIEILVLAALVIVTLVIVIWMSFQQRKNATLDPHQLEAMVNQVFGQSVQKITEQSRQVLASEKETIQLDLDNKQRTLENLVKQLQDDMKVRQEEIRGLERDRTQKFSQLETALKEYQVITKEIKLTTEGLAKVLSNNQLRGEWGERIIEDLMQSNGLLEGIHYLKQATQVAGTLRPDITLLLPNKRIVAVDVKFPYAEIQKMAMAETAAAKQVHVKQFTIDVRQKITKVATYIDPSQNTLDYAILFVPNEMIFSFINQTLPELVDEALAKRVLIVSPFTFLIVARTVIESYRNFMLSDRLREVMKTIDEFVGEWSKFQDKFQKYGRTLDTLKSDYEELSTTRVRQMERRIEKVTTVGQTALLADPQQVTLEEA